MTAVLAAEAPVPTSGSVLRNRHFRRLAISLATSQAGDWIYNVALLGLVFERTHSAAWLSATTVARLAPIVLFGPLGGVIAARYDRRITMITCDLVRAALMLALFAVAVLHLPILLVPAVAALATAVSSPYPACAAATTARLVPDESLPAANAVRAVLGPLCVVLGPVIGAVLLALGSAGVAFVVNGATFVVSAVAVAGLPAPACRPSSNREPGQRLLPELLDGARVLWANRPALRMVGADILCSAVYGVETVALIVLSGRLGLGSNGYGLLLAAIGAGGVIGAVLAGRLPGRWDASAVVACALVLLGVPTAALAGAHAVSGALVLVAVGGLGATIVEVFVETALQRCLDESVYARAYGFAFPVSIGGIAIGGLVASPLISAVGLSGTLAAIGTLVTLYAIWLLIFDRTHRPVAARAGR